MKVIVDGLAINYQDEGRGDVILMLHGWGTDLHTFDGLADKLRDKFRVIRLDFPGFSSSEEPHKDWSVSDYSQFTRRFLDKLNLKDIYVVIAHSFGGRVAIKALAGSDPATRSDLATQKMVLMGSAGVKPAMTVKKVLYQTVAKTGKAVTALPGLSKLRPVLKRRLYGAVKSTDYLEATSPRMRQIFLNVINEDLRKYAAQIDIPSLLIWGESDTSTPLRDGQTLHKLIKNSELRVIKDAGHFVYIDAPNKVYEHIKGFIS